MVFGLALHIPHRKIPHLYMLGGKSDFRISTLIPSDPIAFFVEVVLAVYAFTETI